MLFRSKARVSGEWLRLRPPIDRGGRGDRPSGLRGEAGRGLDALRSRSRESATCASEGSAGECDPGGVAGLADAARGSLIGRAGPRDEQDQADAWYRGSGREHECALLLVPGGPVADRWVALLRHSSRMRADCSCVTNHTIEHRLTSTHRLGILEVIDGHAARVIDVIETEECMDILLPYRTEPRLLFQVLEYAKGKGIERAALEARLGGGETLRETLNALEQLGLISRDDGAEIRLTEEIGRASCRERV